jgi:uncharacterized protein YdcH (DUF465 family)
MSTVEKMMSHYGNLKQKHDTLDSEIEKAYNHHVEDEVVHQMKKEKLHLKEQMFEIEKQLGMTDGKSVLYGNN